MQANHFDIPAPMTKCKTVADWEYHVLSVEAELNLDGAHDAFVWYVTQGCHPAIASQRALVQAFHLEADRLAIRAT